MWRNSLPASLCGLTAMLPLTAALAQTTHESTLPGIDVISTSVLPGLGTPLKDVPANVQVYSNKDIARQGTNNLADFLERNATSVSVNAGQGNPWQPDISFRGFTASPLLGLPQGLSVFQDGVRVNEPFGDVVNWDLIPQSAISSLQLLPGSQPGFGLNTLGGALSVYTKSGITHPGGSLEMQGGSFGRRAVEFEQGGHQGDWNYFFTGNQFTDDGWGEHNPSQVQQFFGKLGYAAGNNAIDVSLTLADNSLQGSQTIPQSFSNNIRQAYTFPDLNSNKLNFLSIKGSHFLDDRFSLDSNVYVRQYRNQNTSSNVNGNYDGVTNLIQATNDKSTIDQSSYGMGLQLTYQGLIADKKHQLVVGTSADLGSAVFTQEVQDAAFKATRDTVGIGDFALTTHAVADNRYLGLFFNDTVTLDERWALTVSGRYNTANIKITDQTGVAPELNGEHQFARFNPAVGVNFNPSSSWTAYATYNEGMRTPTPIELTCANPAAPCKLPNNFLSDPPLQMVVAKTFEMGLRGKRGDSFQWSAALYRTELNDDIQFISSLGAGSNSGYFQNVGNTLRQGLELSASNAWGPLKLSLHYGYMEAIYQTPFTVSSPANASADAAGNIYVSAGNQIPALPRHTLKVRLDADINAQWSAGLSLNGSGAIYARGDESNQDVNGQVPGFMVVNMDARFRVSKYVEIFANVNNLLDHTYATFGTLGSNVFTGANSSFDALNTRNEQFLGYGAPRGAWVGLRFNWL